MTAKIVTNVTRLGYTGNEQLTDFSTVSIFWSYGFATGTQLHNRWQIALQA
jgi:hypothetical protein